MIRGALFVLIASGLTVYAFWVYLRVDLSVPTARWLASARALTLVLVLALLFDLRLPTDGAGRAATEWALLDASLSMGATGADGGSAWEAARARARALDSDGYHVVTFGADPPRSDPEDERPTELGSLLVPALQRAAEGGARRAIVLSDGRFEDAVAVRSALETLPVEVSFETFGEAVVNAGVSRFVVPDFAQTDEGVTAEVEVHGGRAGDSLTVEVHEEGRVVATQRAAAPTSGLRSRVSVDLPPPTGRGRVRYSAVVHVDGDAFPDDDEAVDYAAIGREEGALVLLSLTPDWEPRYLLPVLREVTGLPTIGYLRAGPDRFVQAGRAVDRGAPVDSASVRAAVTDAALVVVHGLGGDLDAWARALVARPGRRILMPFDIVGARLAGVDVTAARAGEWYVSADVPASPIAGALTGAALTGLPPLSGALVPTDADVAAPLLLQLRGAGTPVPALRLDERPTGRVAVTLASGYWRWAAREVGRDAYRRLWSGVVGWIQADQAVRVAEPRPLQWVVERGAPVVWSIPEAATDSRIVVRAADSVVVDTVAATGGSVATPALPPGSYDFRIEGPAGDTLAAGRFDVAAATEEMLPAAGAPPEAARVGGVVVEDAGRGRPLRTSPWPYLLVIVLLCGEWIGRRRSGLR